MMRKSSLLKGPASWVFALAVILLPVSPFAAEDGGDVSNLPVGSAAPVFEATDVKGTVQNLEKIVADGPVLLIFWSIF